MHFCKKSFTLGLALGRLTHVPPLAEKIPFLSSRAAQVPTADPCQSHLIRMPKKKKAGAADARPPDIDVSFLMLLSGSFSHDASLIVRHDVRHDVRSDVDVM